MYKILFSCAGMDLVANLALDGSARFQHSNGTQVDLRAESCLAAFGVSSPRWVEEGIRDLSDHLPLQLPKECDLRLLGSDAGPNTDFRKMSRRVGLHPEPGNLAREIVADSNHSQGLLILLARHPNPWIRAVSAQDPGVPEAVWSRLLHDDHLEVRVAATRNPGYKLEKREATG